MVNERCVNPGDWIEIVKDTMFINTTNDDIKCIRSGTFAKYIGDNYNIPIFDIEGIEYIPINGNFKYLVTSTTRNGILETLYSQN